jgi:hypothetical protein
MCCSFVWCIIFGFHQSHHMCLTILHTRQICQNPAKLTSFDHREFITWSINDCHAWSERSSGNCNCINHELHGLHCNRVCAILVIHSWKHSVWMTEQSWSIGDHIPYDTMYSIVNKLAHNQHDVVYKDMRHMNHHDRRQVIHEDIAVLWTVEHVCVLDDDIIIN